ncbi:hypothetical protein DFH28DRAFT_431064 [Melampsora americana]|nr:hypothetical protein DFH28DRAFT_431064 [Melampsora americana]
MKFMLPLLIDQFISKEYQRSNQGSSHTTQEISIIMFKMMRNLISGSTTEEDTKVSSNILISLPGGRLDILHSGYAKKVERKCIFLDAEATIRRTSTPFQFELAITRVLAEG